MIISSLISFLKCFDFIDDFIEMLGKGIQSNVSRDKARLSSKVVYSTYAYPVAMQMMVYIYI